MAKFRLNILAPELYRVSSSTRTSPVYSSPSSKTIEAFDQDLHQAVQTISHLRQENSKFRQTLHNQYDKKIKDLEYENERLSKQLLSSEKHFKKNKELKEKLENLKQIASDKEKIIKLQESKLIEIGDMIRDQMMQVKSLISYNSELNIRLEKAKQNNSCGIESVEEDFKDFFNSCKGFKKHSVYKNLKRTLGCFEVVQDKIRKNKCVKIVRNLIDLIRMLLPLALRFSEDVQTKSVLTQTIVSTSSLIRKLEIEKPCKSLPANNKLHSIDSPTSSFQIDSPTIIPDPCISLEANTTISPKYKSTCPEPINNPFEETPPSLNITESPSKSIQISNKINKRVLKTPPNQEISPKSSEPLSPNLKLPQEPPNNILPNLSNKNSPIPKEKSEPISTPEKPNLGFSNLNNDLTNLYSQEESRFLSRSPSIEDPSPHTNSAETSRIQRSKWNMSGFMNLHIPQNLDSESPASQPPQTIPEEFNRKKTINRLTKIPYHNESNRFTEYVRPTFKEEGVWDSVKNFFTPEDNQ
ncbi:hypothetical protein SteCoe_4194 [Stentor coeruleus]|uniref:Uncharacterized protein n=1 Tax=Stentor coeruleus TaxID=5963 RepID=A0A1R2CVG6_9CILI|nr:hypothetical protein SteCoe_4194 [Stentor coeruleus]